MGANILVILAAAAIGAVAGVTIGNIYFDVSPKLISVGFSDWLTNKYCTGGWDDAILWGTAGCRGSSVELNAQVATPFIRCSRRVLCSHMPAFGPKRTWAVP